MRLVIEHAVPADVPAIWALQRIAFEVEAMRYDDWSIPPLTQTLEALADEFREFTVLKAIAEGQLVGSIRARVNRDVCEIGRLMVHPSFQRRGIGARLLQAIEGACSEAVRFELFTGSKSESNIRLYQHAGYCITRSQPQSPRVSIVYLKKQGCAPARPFE